MKASEYSKSCASFCFGAGFRDFELGRNFLGIDVISFFKFILLYFLFIWLCSRE